MGAFLALAACSRPPTKEAAPPLYETLAPSICAAVGFQDAGKALGSPPVGATDTADHGALNPGCSWMAATESLGPTPRMLVLTVWRKKALDMQSVTMSGRALYDNEVQEIADEFGTLHPVRGVGQAAQIGYLVETGGRVRARLVALKGPDVLTMRLDGADREAFEAIAGRVAKAM